MIAWKEPPFCRGHALGGNVTVVHSVLCVHSMPYVPSAPCYACQLNTFREPNALPGQSAAQWACRSSTSAATTASLMVSRGTRSSDLLKVRMPNAVCHCVTRVPADMHSTKGLKRHWQPHVEWLSRCSTKQHGSACM